MTVEERRKLLLERNFRVWVDLVRGLECWSNMWCDVYISSDGSVQILMLVLYARQMGWL
jgi:hypothetical protein